MHQDTTGHSVARQQINRREFLATATGTTLGAALASALDTSRVWAADAPAFVSPVVNTANGKVRGASVGGVHIFKGLPYGASTAGANRFRPPQPPESWTAVRDLYEFGPLAPQRNPDPARAAATAAPYAPGTYRSPFAIPAGLPDREDCLVLDVYTPGATTRVRRPVMVWLHGGGFATGSASAPGYSGANLAKRGDVVVVGVNHRLNVLGYTYLAELGGSDFADSGNAGMLDIVQALQWVRDNIAQFGGDPASVMIFGESGGGSKVSTLLAMPAAAGLFHRASIQSGPGIRMTPRDEATRAAESLLKALGLQKSQVRELQKLPLATIMAAHFSGQNVGGGRPVVDGGALPRHPFDPDAPATSATVPVMIGYNRTEPTYFELSANPELVKMTEDEMKTRVKNLLGDNSQKVIDLYRQADPQASPYRILSLIVTDRGTGANSIKIAERKSAQGKAPAFLYNFAWETKVAGLMSPHTIEIPFCFHNMAIAKSLVGDDPAALKLADQVCDAWVAFAKTGDPSTAALPKWLPYDATNRNTMVFNIESKVEKDPLRDKRLLLNQLAGAS